ncbi:amino acid ABC transporter permease [Saccharopolyspora taberi]|uniref:Amino acid ABC transporter permease n=1 Tax=Saccharopolyspora taberi TaxID=60895 RepID=A0ABN3VEL8_9PSEU
MTTTQEGVRRAPEDDDLDLLTVVPARYPWRWVAGAVTLIVVATVVHGLITNPAWEWSTVAIYVFNVAILESVVLTLTLTFLGIVLGFLLGTVLALMRLSASPLLRGVSWTYVWIFRSVPLILQLLFWYNIAILYNRIELGIPFGPTLLSVSTMSLIPPLGAATLGLTLHQAAYSAEIVRSGLLSIDHGQLEAAAALGIPRRRQLSRIILPQAMRTIIPAAGNEIIGMVKGTSVVYIMALPELFYQVQVIYQRTGRIIPMLVVATIWYVLMTTVLSVGQYYVERHFSKGAARNLAPTPLRRLRGLLADRRRARTGEAS